MKKTSKVEISAGELQQAVKDWLEKKGEKPVSPVKFHIGREENDDFMGPGSAIVKGAYCDVEA